MMEAVGYEQLTDCDAGRSIQGVSRELRDGQQEVADEEAGHVVGLAPPVEDVVGRGQEARGDEGHGQEEHREQQSDGVDSEADVVPGGGRGARTSEDVHAVVGLLEDVLYAELGDDLVLEAECAVGQEVVGLVQFPGDSQGLRLRTDREALDESHVGDLQILRVHFTRRTLLTEHSTPPATLLHPRQCRRVGGLGGHTQEAAGDVHAVPPGVHRGRLDVRHCQRQRPVLQEEERGRRRVL